MHDCPYCSYPLLRHIQHHEICWFCSHCWTTVPVFSEVLTQLDSSENLQHALSLVLDSVNCQPESTE